MTEEKTRSLEELLELAKTVEMTEEQKEEQRRDWVYGNTKLSNPAITRELVDEVADKMPSCTTRIANTLVSRT